MGGHYYNDPVNGTVINVGGWVPYLFQKFGYTNAETIGNYVLTTQCKFLDAPHYAHELGHVDQYRVLGPLFLPLYLTGAAIGKVRGDDHDGNPFEIDADARARLFNSYSNPDDINSWLPYHPNDISLRW